jgi:hypothetical protein
MPASPNNMFAQQGVTITDAAGNRWTIVNGQVVVNGVVDQTTANVVSLAYENGQVWQMNADRLWWAKSSPTDSWTPTFGTTVSPLSDFSTANNTVLSQFNSTGVITDANNDHWTIRNGQVAVNGVVDPTTANVDALAYVNGQVWQENASGLWWGKSNAAAAWEPATGTSVSPVMASPTNLVTPILPPGITTVPTGGDNSDGFVFGGINSPFDATLPTLQFIGSGNNVVSALIVSGFPNSPRFGAIDQFGSNVEDDGGFNINNGRLDDHIGNGQSLVVGAPGTIDNGGSLFIDGSGATVQLDTTVTVGALGSNELYLNDVNLTGGIIAQNGENDKTYVGGTDVTPGDDGSVNGTEFVINGGTLDIAWPGGFNGTIGSAIGSSIGIFGEVDIENAMAVASGTFDTSTGVLSLLNAGGTDLGDFHLAGDASGIVLNMRAGGILAINDHPSASQGNIGLTFHS